MSSLPKLTFPDTLSGGHHAIALPTSSTSRQEENSTKCVFIAQSYPCPLHPSNTTPHLLHRSPCPQALLPPSQQSPCKTPPRISEHVKTLHSARERGCISCKAEARSRRRDESTDHAKITRKMGELGLRGKRKTGGGRRAREEEEEERIVELEDSDVPGEMDASLPLTSFRESSAQTTESDVLPAKQEPEFEIDEIDGEIGDEWDWGDKREKMWGEVALAPGATIEKRDEWVVIGSWGEDERL